MYYIKVTPNFPENETIGRFFDFYWQMKDQSKFYKPRTLH